MVLILGVDHIFDIKVVFVTCDEDVDKVGQKNQEPILLLSSGLLGEFDVVCKLTLNQHFVYDVLGSRFAEVDS